MADATTGGIGTAPVPTRWLSTTPIESTDRPCEMTRLDVEARVRGLHALVSETMQIHNPNPRDISVDVSIELPDGATVCGYALEVGDMMVDGVVVPKEEARVVFETERRRGADPGLAEAVRGNAYKTRIYPVPAKGTRKVRLDYVVPLSVASGESAALGLPMPAERIARRSVRIEIEMPGCERPLIEGLGAEPVEMEGTWVAESLSTDVTPEGPASVTIPGVPLPLVMTEKDNRGDVWFVAAEAVPEAKADAPTLRSLAILWDASGSRAGDGRQVEIDLAGSWLADGTIGEATLVTFSNEIHEIETYRSAEALVDRLSSIRYDGGTDLGAVSRALREVDGLAGKAADGHACVLLTDGLDTLSESGLDVPAGCDVLAVVSGRTRDLEGMRQACRGHAATIDEAPRGAEALAREFSEATNARRVAVSGEGVEYACDAGIRGGAVRCALGRLVAEETELSIGDGGQALRVSASEARGGDMLAKAWAARRVALLAPSATENREELLSIGRRFGIVSPVSSLLVLETLDQWLRYDIRPPETWEEMRSAWDRLREGRMQEGADEGMRARHLADLERAWKGLLEWHAAEHPQLQEARTRAAWVMASGPDSPPRPGAPVFDGLARAGQLLGGMTVLRQALGNPRHATLERRSAASHPNPFGDMGAVPDDDSMPGAALNSISIEGEAYEDDFDGCGDVLCDCLDIDATAYDEAAAPSTGEVPADDARTVRVRPWMPDTPYLSVLDEAAGKDGDVATAVDAYAGMRDEYAASPSFFLDCTSWFMGHGDEREAIRILTNLAEVTLDDAATLRILGWRLREAGRLAQAKTILEKVLALREEDSQSLRDLALVLSEMAREAYGAGDMQGAARLAEEAAERYRTIALTPWARRAVSAGLFAVEENNVLRAWVDGQEWPEGQTPDIPLVSPALEGVLDCDLRVTMAWDSDDTDIDIHVTEPSGEEAYYAHNRTASGGRVSEDITDGYGPELYETRRALPGDYVIRAHYYASHQQTVFGPATCTLTVYTDWGRPGQTQRTVITRLDQERSMVPVATASYGKEAAERANSGEAPAPGELETLAGHEEEVPQALRKGMAEDAVIAIMGEPEATAEDEDGRLLKWTRGGGREVLALVVDGSLAMATETTPWGDETIIVS